MISYLSNLDNTSGQIVVSMICKKQRS